MGNLFGTDGIRGLANIYPMDAETAVAVGRAAARYFQQNDPKKQKLVLIGQDTRLSGDMLAQSVGAGLCSAGMNVIMLGVMPTPAVAFLTRHASASAGIVISASHNPFADNGIKLFDSNGYKLDDAAEYEIEALIDDHKTDIAPDQIGRLETLTDGCAPYMRFLKNAAAGLNLKGMKLVVDCSNGATYQVAPELFENLGAEVTAIHNTPNGTNINDACGSQYPGMMAKEVLAQGADIGLAFDGDGDRLIAVDENGVILTGDQIMAICAKDLKNKGKLKNNKVVATVYSNIGFHAAMKALDIELLITQVGDRQVMQEMMAQDASIGGEDSGHVIFRDKHTTGDGIMAALCLLEAMQTAGSPLSVLAEVMTIFPQELINVDVSSKPDLETVPEIRDAIHEAEAKLGDLGRVLVRYSGTQPKCRVMVEGPTLETTRETCRKLADVVARQLS